MSQQCCNAVLAKKTSLQIVSCKFTSPLEMLAAVESKGRKGILPPIDNIVDGVEGIVLDCGCKTGKGN